MSDERRAALAMMLARCQFTPRRVCGQMISGIRQAAVAFYLAAREGEPVPLSDITACFGGDRNSNWNVVKAVKIVGLVEWEHAEGVPRPQGGRPPNRYFFDDEVLAKMAAGGTVNDGR